jgi:histidinol-phosphate aminotransferase
MVSVQEKGGGAFEGIKMLLCENPLPPLEEAIAAAAAELPRSNYYTEAYSAPLRQVIATLLDIPEQLVHVNAGSELILRQLFGLHGQRVHLLTPTYPLFLEVAESYTETQLQPETGFSYELGQLQVPAGTTMVAIVNPNNPTGRPFDMTPLPSLLQRYPDTLFLVDEAFIDFGGESVVALVTRFPNVCVTRTLSKAHSLAGFRVGYCVMPPTIADYLNTHNDAYPLARAAQAAAIATLRHDGKIRERVTNLREWARSLAREIEALGVRTFPSESYFFLADFSPRDATTIAQQLKQRGILIKPLGDARLGPGFMRVTTALPADNKRFIAALKENL